MAFQLISVFTAVVAHCPWFFQGGVDFSDTFLKLLAAWLFR